MFTAIVNIRTLVSQTEPSAQTRATKEYKDSFLRLWFDPKQNHLRISSYDSLVSALDSGGKFESTTCINGAVLWRWNPPEDSISAVTLWYCQRPKNLTELHELPSKQDRITRIRYATNCTMSTAIDVANQIWPEESLDG